MPRRRRFSHTDPPPGGLPDEAHARAHPLRDAADLDPLLERVGDARFTDMADDGMVNLGQLARERHGPEGVVLVGFGSHRGRVIAGREWEAPMERMPVPPGRPGSWEDLLHAGLGGDGLLLFGADTVSAEWLAPRGHRAIGVVYHPEYERHGNYVPTALPRRYDAFLYLDETEALHPLHMRVRHEGEVPETFPTGV
jgi:erythromycin esterase-like protein